MPNMLKTRPAGGGAALHMVGRNDGYPQDAVRDRWTDELARIGSGSTWMLKSLETVSAAAAANPELRRLFPFTAMTRLCFSRCSAFPYTTDCPCIAVDGDRYSVLSSWTVADLPAHRWAEVDNPVDAVAVAVTHLPSARYVWIGRPNQDRAFVSRDGPRRVASA